jgi:serine/threonine protein kinase
VGGFLFYLYHVFVFHFRVPRNQKNLVFKHITPANLLFDPSCSLVKIADVGTVKDKHIILGYVSNELRYMKYIAPENFHMDSDHEDDCVLQHSDRYTKSDAWNIWFFC